MITPEILQTIKQHKQDSKIAVIRNLSTATPSWQEFIDYIDKCSYATEDVMPQPNDYDKSLGAVSIGKVMIKEGFYFYLGIDGHINQASKQIEDEFAQTLGSPKGGISSIYVNFSSNIKNIPQHFDPYDNFYWQCIGSTTWHCEDKSYVVNPGDLVYIPSNTYHGVDFSMPRAAIGFSWLLD
jgi:mannose-6-phosphate isomerase-like protein (cupin superfamily)